MHSLISVSTSKSRRKKVSEESENDKVLHGGCSSSRIQSDLTSSFPPLLNNVYGPMARSAATPHFKFHGGGKFRNVILKTRC